MIVPTRELVNTLFLSTTKDSKFDLIVLDNYNIDMDIDTSRERTPSSSTNSSRVSLTHSNASSISYHERMTIQSKNLSWSEQVENEEEIFSLSYTTLKVGEETLANKAIDNSPKDRVNYVNNEAPALNNMFNPQGKNKTSNNTNMYASQDVIEFSLSYNIHNPVKPNSWDIKAYSISVFGTIKFLDTDARNIYTSFLCMLDFIKKRSANYK